MIDNWRSAKLLIQENEQLIGQYAQWVAQYFAHEGWNDESPLANMAMSIYHPDAIHQEAQKDYPGVFQLQFIGAKAEDLIEQTLQAVDQQLQALREEGWEWNNIAMLVRRGDDAELLARYLIEKGYPVESAEGMRIQSHSAVQLLVALMQHHVQPTNEVVQYAIRTLHAPFTEKQTAAINKALTQPLYEAVQGLITELELSKQAGALPYLTAFQDQVYQFTQKRVSDIASFLEYWEKKAPKATIPSSPVVNAIRILTIHSSKGLEFDVVMLPFLNWDIQRTHMGEIFWCQPQTEPFNQMPLVAVPLSSKLLKTHFKKEYINEIISQYIDNLNLTYVAFTRPKMRLYAYGQMYATTKDNKPQISKISHLLSYLYDQVIAENSLYCSCTVRLIFPAAFAPPGIGM
jgi:ATP-dependent exoDNAse (exonuclease V) beta subunit